MEIECPVLMKADRGLRPVAQDATHALQHSTAAAFFCLSDRPLSWFLVMWSLIACHHDHGLPWLATCLTQDGAATSQFQD